MTFEQYIRYAVQIVETYGFTLEEINTLTIAQIRMLVPRF